MDDWKEASALFFDALHRLSDQQTHKEPEGVLSIHGAKLGGIEAVPREAKDDDGSVRSVDTNRVKREKALYEIRSVAMPLLVTALNAIKEREPPSVLAAYKMQLELFKRVETDLSLETPANTILTYIAVLQVNATV